MKSILKNLSFSFSSNLISMIISILVTFIVPRYLGVDDYGFYQLYILYCSYIGFLHFGWADGIFLRYGGDEYDALVRPRFSAQFWLFSALISSMATLMCFSSITYVGESEKSQVLLLTGLAVFLLLPRTFLQYVLQCTNKIKEYAILVILEKIAFFILTFLALVTGHKSFQIIIMADLAGKALALIYAMCKCNTIIFCKPEPLCMAIPETQKNISVGIKLMFSNILSMLIIGIVRISIERQWDIATFGQVSLTLSVSNLLMIFIRAVALVMFPILRRTKIEKLAEIYMDLRTGLMIPLLGILVVYYPLKEILMGWLPAYADKLNYMALLFPICIFESKTSMLIETYMKTLRMEKKLLFVNSIILGLSIISTAITVFVWKSLNFAVLSIVLLMAIRCILAETILAKTINISVWVDIFLEVGLSALFIVVNWFVGGMIGLGIYAIAYITYLYFKKNDVKSLILKTKSRLKLF